MQRLSFLFSLLFIYLWTPNLSYSYTVVLKSGKTVEGKWIAEDDSTIQVQDSEGIFLSFKKSVLNMQAMSDANQPVASAEQPRSSARQPAISLADIARETKKRRTGQARVVTQKDLSGDAAVSIFGESTADLSSKEKELPAQMPDRNERYWRSQTALLKRELLAAEEKKRQAETDCYKMRNASNVRSSKRHKDEVLILQAPQEPLECKRVQDFEARWQEVNQRWIDFQERARKEEVPWQWLE